MSNPSRAKGTQWEVQLLPILRRLFGAGVERAPLKGIQDKGDFVGVPWLHEAKNVLVPHFEQWARQANKKTGLGNWVVIWKGDRRKQFTEPLVLMPLHFYMHLIDCTPREWLADLDARNPDAG